MFHPPLIARPCDASHAQLLQQLTALWPDPRGTWVDSGHRPWASASFSGARHWFRWQPADRAAHDTAMAASDAALTDANWLLVDAIVADTCLMSKDSGDAILVEMLEVHD